MGGSERQKVSPYGRYIGYGDNEILKTYGISQNPNTKDYIIVFQYLNCEKCNTIHEYYIPCHVNYLKKNFTEWTSGNDKIDRLIQKKQLTIDNSNDIVFEWIPFNQFNDIEKIGKGG